MNNNSPGIGSDTCRSGESNSGEDEAFCARLDVALQGVCGWGRPRQKASLCLCAMFFLLALGSTTRLLAATGPLGRNIFSIHHAITIFVSIHHAIIAMFFNPCMMLNKFHMMLGRPLIDLDWLFHSFWQGMESFRGCEKDDLQPAAVSFAAVGHAEIHLQQHQAWACRLVIVSRCFFMFWSQKKRWTIAYSLFIPWPWQLWTWITWRVTTMCPGLHSSWGMEFGRRSRPGLNQKNLGLKLLVIIIIIV